MAELTAITAPFVEVLLKPWEYSRAAEIGANRSAHNHANSNWRSGFEKTGETDLVAQYAACAAELAAAQVLNQYPTAVGAWESERHSEFSTLPDVGFNIDVKRIRNAESQAFSFSNKEIELNRTLAVCYVLPDLRTVRVLGWVSASTAVEAGWKTTSADTGESWYRAPLKVLRHTGTPHQLNVVVPATEEQLELNYENGAENAT